MKVFRISYGPEHGEFFVSKGGPCSTLVIIFSLQNLYFAMGIRILESDLDQLGYLENLSFESMHYFEKMLGAKEFFSNSSFLPVSSPGSLPW